MSLVRMLLLLALLHLGGCSSVVNLQEVRDFASESVKLGSYSELSTRYRDTYQRELPYLAPGNDKLAKNNDARRRAAYDDFVHIQKSVVLYMQTLGTLAGDTQYQLTGQIDSLGAGLKANPELGIEPRHVQAYTGMARLLARTLAGAQQARSVEAMVRDADADLQQLLDAMRTLTRLYDKSNANEKKQVLGFFDVELPFSNRPEDRLLAALARAHLQTKNAEYRLIDRRFALAEQGLAAISAGHQKLREHLGELSLADTRTLIANLGRDLRMIRAGLQDNDG